MFILALISQDHVMIHRDWLIVRKTAAVFSNVTIEVSTGKNIYISKVVICESYKDDIVRCSLESETLLSETTQQFTYWMTRLSEVPRYQRLWTHYSDNSSVCEI